MSTLFYVLCLGFTLELFIIPALRGPLVPWTIYRPRPGLGPPALILKLMGADSLALGGPLGPLKSAPQSSGSEPYPLGRS